MSPIASSIRNHQREAWSLRSNPLPTEAIDGRDDDPYADEAFAEEITQFVDKVLVAGLSPRRKVAFLYSHAPHGGEDTGFGKTKTMRAMRTAINEDLGAGLLASFGVEEDQIVPIGAAYASFNVHQRTGYYAVLVEAVLDAATSGDRPLLDRARDRIIERVGEDPVDIKAAVTAAQVDLAPGAQMRGSLVEAFARGGAGSAIADIASTSDATKVRSGLQWLNFLMVVLHAAGIKRLFLFIDQLEDLATNRSQTRARRFREIGRIRDLLEDEPGRSMLHTTFTMHDTAGADLHEFWVPHRLPSYELRRANMGSIVLLEGLSQDAQAADILRAWLEPERIDGYSGGHIHPFEMSAVRALREYSEGRVGKLLPDASKVLDAARTERVVAIDGDYVRGVLDDGSGAGGGPDPDVDDIDDSVDDLLA